MTGAMPGLRTKKRPFAAAYPMHVHDVGARTRAPFVLRDRVLTVAARGASTFSFDSTPP